MRSFLYIILLSLVLMYTLLFTWSYQSIFLVVGVVLIMVLDKLGKGIVLRELIALHTSFVCLAMPALGYLVYNRTNSLALLWVRYMPVRAEQYFDFAFPACVCFVIALCWPFRKAYVSDEGDPLLRMFQKVKVILQNKEMAKVGFILIALGMFMSFANRLLPSSLRFISLLFYFSSFAGFLYYYFSPPKPNRSLILFLFAAFLFANALRSGMFTVIVYMGITLFSFFFLGFKLALWKKIVLFGIAVFSLVVIQTVKPAYRKFTWRSNYQENKAVLFLNLVTESIKKGEFFSEDSFFFTYYRTNQGFNVALVMRRIPAFQEHNGGKTLAMNFLSAFIPRILWPEKPEAGGRFNMEHYTGVVLSGGWSTNIGPLGEAWGSFGKWGGIAYMIILGLFIRFIYKKIFLVARTLPLVICWIPVLFYQVTYSAETDSLQIFNSVFKSAFFIWVLYRFYPLILGKIKKNVKPGRQLSVLTQT